MSAAGEPRMLSLHAVPHAFGELVVGERGDLPFEPRRAYFVHGIPAGARRGGHAHRRCEEVIVAVRGSFRATIEPAGRAPLEFALSDPRRALYLPPRCWMTLDAFANDTVFIVFASLAYAEEDYIRDWREFRGMAGPLREA